MINHYYVDTETTGLVSKNYYHEITEISIIRCSDKVQFTEFIRAEYPEHSSIDALRITNKTLADLENGVSRSKVIAKINKFLNEDGLTPEHRCLWAHNYSFDKKFIHALYETQQQQLPVSLWGCTMALTKHYAKKQGIIKPKVNLQAACDLAGIKKIASAHNSKMDARNGYLLWKDLIENKGIDYLPFIKSCPHRLLTELSEDEEDLLDL